MKDYFDLKVFISVIVALVVFSVIDKLFLDKLTDKLKKEPATFEETIDLDDDNDDDLV